MADCATCPHHSGLEADIKKVCALLEERKELTNVRINQIREEVVLARTDMERRLEGMNGLEARTTARTTEAENRVREQTASAEKKLAEQAGHFITRGETDTKMTLMQTAINAEIKVLSKEIDTMKGTSNVSAGSRKVTDWFVMALISGAIVALAKLIHL
jgi:hypothetical protein